jgi:hypothetical protein
VAFAVVATGDLLVASELAEDVAHGAERVADIERPSCRLFLIQGAGRDLAGGIGDDRSQRHGTEVAGRLEEAQHARRIREAIDCGHHVDELNAGEPCDVHVVGLEQIVDVGAQDAERS